MLPDAIRKLLMSARCFMSNCYRWLCVRCHDVSTALTDSTPDQSESGAALVEFTVMVPLFLLVVFGIIEFGMIFFHQTNMLDAARDTARTIATCPSEPQTAAQIACNYLACNDPNLSTQNFSVNFTDSCTAAQVGTQTRGDVTVQVSVATTAAAVFNYLGMFTGNTLQAQVRMQKGYICKAAGSSTTVVCPPTSCTALAICP